MNKKQFLNDLAEVLEKHEVDLNMDVGKYCVDLDVVSKKGKLELTIKECDEWEDKDITPEFLRNEGDKYE